MTIASILTQIRYSSNGVAVAFPFPNKIFATTDLIVTLIDTQGVIYSFTNQANVALGLSYTIANVDSDSGSTVFFNVSPTAVWQIDLRSLVPDLQSTSVKNQGTFLPELHEEAFDRLTREIQDLLRLTYTYGIHGPDSEIVAWPALPAPAQRKGLILGFDLVTGLPTAAVVTNTVVTQSLLGQLLFPQTLAESQAGVVPTNFFRFTEPYDTRREGAVMDNATDDTVALNKALLVAGQAVNGSLGGAISMATGVSLLSSLVLLPNRVRVLGVNKRGSYFKATAGWSFGNGIVAYSAATAYLMGQFVLSGGIPYIARQNSTNQTPAASPTFWNPVSNAMFYAQNYYAGGAGISMFDSTLENVTVDCNSLANLGCVLSSAWQEDCGLRGVLLINFSTYGVKYQDGFGGASLSKIVDCEIFGGAAAGAIGIDVEQVSLSGSVFLLNVTDTSITGGAFSLDRGINMVAENLHCRSVHFETTVHGIYLQGAGNHTLIGVTGATTVTNLVTIDSNFTGTVKMLGCSRNGTTNFLNDQRVRQVAQLGAITGGAGYVSGTYSNVPLTGGTGAGATAQVVVAAGIVTQVNMSKPGTGYTVGDSLTTSNANLGGSGAGFAVPVFQIFTGYGVLAGRDFSDLTIAPSVNLTLTGESAVRSPFSLFAWGVFDGTLAGTNAPAAGQNVLNVQRTGVGRYLVTLANALTGALQMAVIPTNGSPTLLTTAAPAGAASLNIAINNSGTGAATDSNDVRFIVVGL